MITLTIDGNPIELSSKPSFNIDWENPFFSRDYIPSAIVYSVKSPASANNNLSLGFPREITNTKTFGAKLPEAKLSVGNVLNLFGTVTINSADNETIDLSFNGETSRFQRVVGNSLRSLNYGGLRTVSPSTVADIKAHMLASISGTSDTWDYVYAPFIVGPFDVLNFYNPNTAQFDDTNFQSIQPFPYLVYVLKQVFIENGYTVDGTFLEDPEIKTLTIYSVGELENYLSFSASPTFEIKNCVPDITIGDFLIYLQNTFNLGFFFQPGQNRVSIHSFKHIAQKQSYKDWTDKASMGYSVNFNSLETGYKFIQVKDDSDTFGTPTGLEYLYGEADYKEIVTGIVPPLMTEGVIVPTAFTMLIPQIDPDNSTVNWFDNYSPPLRLSFFRGLQPASSGTYPLLTPYDKKLGGVDLPGVNYSLSWDGPKGLIKTWFEPWLEIMTRGPVVNRKVNIDLNDLGALDFSEKSFIKDHYLYVKKLKINIQRNVLQLTDVEYLRA
jgi:hypothetical protein